MASIFELQNPPFGQLTKTKVIKTENAAMTLTTAELIEGIVDGTLQVIGLLPLPQQLKLLLLLVFKTKLVNVLS